MSTGFIACEKYSGTNRKMDMFPGARKKLLIMIQENSLRCFTIVEWETETEKLVGEIELL